MVDLNVPAVEKLLDYTASGIGAVAGPVLLPWHRYWEGKARRIDGRTNAEVRSIEAASLSRSMEDIAKGQSQARGFLQGPGIEVRGSVDLTQDHITQRLRFQERKRLNNIRAVVGTVAETLGDKEVKDHEPDPDWTARFFDGVQDVSSEDMQKLWARILSGEVESSGRSSLRTLDTLRNMTKSDADVFREVCNFVLHRGFCFVLYGSDYRQKHDEIRHYNLLRLQECNLLQFGQTQYSVTDENRQVDYQNLALEIRSRTNNNTRVSFPVATLTKAGSELYEIHQPELKRDYLRSFAAFLSQKDCDLFATQVTERLPGGEFVYANDYTLIVPEPAETGGTTR